MSDRRSRSSRRKQAAGPPAEPAAAGPAEPEPSAEPTPAESAGPTPADSAEPTPAESGGSSEDESARGEELGDGFVRIRVTPPTTQPLVRFVISPAGEEDTAGAAHLYYEEWLLSPASGLPTAAWNSRLDSGVDIPLPADVEIPAGGLVKIPLGVRMRALRLYWHQSGSGQYPPVGQPCAFELRARSSIAQVEKPADWSTEEPRRPQRVLIIPNAPATIDVNYVGELKVQLYNPGREAVRLRRGEALIQATSPDLNSAEYTFAAWGSPLARLAFPETARGAGGFGSTGAGGAGRAADQ